MCYKLNRKRKLMTNKDYIKIAEVLTKNRMPSFLYRQMNDPQTQYHNDVIKCIVNDLCEVFAEDNSRFDADRFKQAVNG